ncbi:hypothetical protein PHMEG_00022036 [Phytophthora megakarya]|uniref:Uncharacterized protein n=1 Tax=Phytophthora megakarya TaxID=4795 RepID=A0A225VJT4_9STRA|nr:hypothetical protein PHMEG_00022036 [Phytophthora megakarya]
MSLIPENLGLVPDILSLVSEIIGYHRREPHIYSMTVKSKSRGRQKCGNLIPARAKTLDDVEPTVTSSKTTRRTVTTKWGTPTT